MQFHDITNSKSIIALVILEQWNQNKGYRICERLPYIVSMVPDMVIKGVDPFPEYSGKLMDFINDDSRASKPEIIYSRQQNYSSPWDNSCQKTLT